MKSLALEAEPLHRVGGHHADFRIRGDGGRADRIGVELHELAEAARSRLLIAEHPADAIAAIGLGQGIEVLGHVAGERRGQVVAQGQPLLVVVLEREHAFVRAVLVGQELAQRVRVFDERRLDALEAVELIRVADRREHALGGGKIGGSAIGKAARRAGLDLVGLGHGSYSSRWIGKTCCGPTPCGGEGQGLSRFPATTAVIPDGEADPGSLDEGGAGTLLPLVGRSWRWGCER